MTPNAFIVGRANEMDTDQEMNMSNNTIELFDSKGYFVMPSPEAIASLDKRAQKRFAAVKTAALAAEAAREATKEANQHVTACIAAVNAADDELREVRPAVSPIDAARQWIKTTR
jgi:hypothetical protein